MNILEYTNTNEYPVRIEFSEAGGLPTAHYKYLTQIRVFSKLEKIFLNFREVREFSSGKPRLIVAKEKELSKEVYHEFLNDLLEHKITHLNRNFITDASNSEKPNYFLLEFGDAVKVRFDYQLVHKETPEFEPYEGIIQSIKNLLYSNLA